MRQMTTRDRLVERGTLYAALVLVLLAGGPVRAQNAISQDGWEGFAMRDTENKFDRCVLYNRSIQALTASPYQMFGITRDDAGRPGARAERDLTGRLGRFCDARHREQVRPLRPL